MLSIAGNIVFFDRGIPDLYSYSNKFCDDVTPEINEAVNQYRYNLQVFLFPPWPDIYCHDTERRQDFKEAVETDYAIKEGYTACGYSVLEVPKDSIKRRVDFILETVAHTARLK